MTNDFDMGVDLTVLPDGFADSNGNLRLSIALSPTRRIGVTPTVSIEDWPTAVSNLASQLRIALGRLSGQVLDGGLTDERTISNFVPGLSVSAPTPAYRTEARDLWRRIFSIDGNFDTGLRDLVAALNELPGAKPLSPPPTPAPSISKRLGTTQPYETAQIIDSIYAAYTANLVGRRAKRVEQRNSRQALSAGFHERELKLGVGWWRSLRQQWLGDVLAADSVSELRRLAGATDVGRAAAIAADQAMADAARLLAPGRLRGYQPQLKIAEDTRAGLRDAATKVLSQARYENIQGDFNTFWTSGGNWPDDGRGPGASLANEFARFAACHGLNHTFKAADLPPPQDRARRKLSGILAHPTLARFLGMTLDVTIPASLLTESGLLRNGYGAIAVHLAGSTPRKAKEVAWTAFVLKVGYYFGPCGRLESLYGRQQNQWLIDGMLNLGANVVGSTPRFALQSQDEINGLLSLARRATAISEAEVKGAFAETQATGLPEVQARGIALVDRAAQFEPARILARQLEITRKIESIGQDPASQEVLIKDAEDLAEGYRIDVAVAPTDGNVLDQTRWRPLMARDVTYPGEIPHEFLAGPDAAAINYREDGHTRPIYATSQRETDLNPNVTVEFVLPSAVLFSWTGENLGLRSVRDQLDPQIVQPGEEDGVNDVLGNDDLAINIDSDLPRAPTRRAPPLREGRSYAIGARVCFANGCGLTFEEAVQRYLSDPKTVIGAPGGGPFLYARRNRINPPDVLLPWTSKIVRDDPVDWPGESVDHLVIRSSVDGASAGRTARFLLPTRTTFDLAEQCGVFDHDRSDTPRGALIGDVGAMLDHISGALPVAVDGSWTFGKPNNRRSRRGAVLVLQSDPRRPWRDYHVDPWSRRVRAKFLPLDNAEDQYGDMGEPVDFWGNRAVPADAMPVEIELKGHSDHQPLYRGGFDPDDNTADLTTHPNRDPVSLKKISVWLRPAEITDLQIWVDCDPETLLRHHHIQGAIAALVTAATASPEQALTAAPSLIKNLKAGDTKTQALQRIVADGPIESVFSARTIRLVHAVDKPLQTPAFAQPGPAAAPGPGFPTWRVEQNAYLIQPVVLVVASGQQNADATWATYVRKVVSCVGVDQRAWPSQEGGVSTFFAGSIKLDRPSTSKVRCEAKWDDYGPDTLKTDAMGNWVKSPTPASARLFSIDDIAFDKASRGLDLEIAYDDVGQLRNFSYAFADGRARRLKLRLICTSRFTAYFPPVPATDTAAVGQYEVASPDFHATPYQIWLPCTFRPPPPDIDRIMPVFRWTTGVADSGRRLTWRRDISLRVFLKLGWWASGEDEQLGLVFPQNPSAEGYSVYANDVTAWGADPTHDSNAPGENLTPAMPPSAVSGPTMGVSESGLDLIIGKTDAPTAIFPDLVDGICGVAVASPSFLVVPFDPQIDPHDGCYCDINIDVAGAYLPFIQLGFVRYQRHASHRLRLSRPTVKWAQVPPNRQGSVFFDSDHQVRFELTGVGFHRSNTGFETAGSRPADLPLLNVKLMYAAREGLNWPPFGSIPWAPVLDDNGKPVEQLHAVPATVAGSLLWTLDITLPNSRHWTHYGLLVEEVELIWGDDPSMDLSGIIGRVGKLVERGPLFSHIVDFWS